MGRGPSSNNKNLRSGSWSIEEDEALKNYIEKHGVGRSWKGLAYNAGLKRCARSCRSRWLNHLRPDLKRGPFTEEEDNIIRTIYNNKGSCWSVIAAHLPGRTDQAIKNRWNTKLKKKATVAQKRLTSNSTSHVHQSSSRIPPPLPSMQARIIMPSSPDAACTGLTMQSRSPSVAKLNEPSHGENQHTLPSTDSGSSEKSMGEPALYSESEIMEPLLPDFDEMVEWYVMSPSHSISLASPSPSMVNSNSHILCFSNWLWCE